jgi:hypothetical protein
MKKVIVEFTQVVTQTVQAEVFVESDVNTADLNNFREMVWDVGFAHYEVEHEQIDEDLIDMVVLEEEEIEEEMSIEDMKLEIATFKANAFLEQEGDLYDMFRQGVVGLDAMSDEDVIEEYKELFGG